MKKQLHPPATADRLQDWRLADEQALRAERRLAHKMTAAAAGGAAPSEAERREAAQLRARANALLGRAIA